jgi:hypothetical protein
VRRIKIVAEAEGVAAVEPIQFRCATRAAGSDRDHLAILPSAILPTMGRERYFTKLADTAGSSAQPFPRLLMAYRV